MKLSSIVIVVLDQRYHVTPVLLDERLFTESRAISPQKYQEILT